MKLDGRIITIDQVPEHLSSLLISDSFRPKFVVLHNTSTPDISLYNSWMKRGNPTPEQWLKNLASYYSGLGWNSMPHAFILPDGRIGLGAPFNVRGTHTPSWNSFSIGIECVGEFDREQWMGTPTEKAAVALFGELCKKFDWVPNNYVRGVKGIHFHREDPGTTHKDCPGRNVGKTVFVGKVLAYMGDSAAAAETDTQGHADVPVSAQEAPETNLTKEQLTSISWVQERLVAKGIKLLVDGILGPATKSAVKEYQQAHPPLVADGVAGPLTRQSLAS